MSRLFRLLSLLYLYIPIYGNKIPNLVASDYCLVYKALKMRGIMNYLSPRDLATKGALAESAPKKVSLYPNLGSPKAANTRKRTGRLSYCNGHDAMITAAQLRAARGLLDWTRADLAKAANISPETVKNIEHGTFRPQEQTAEQIIKAFGAHDVEFTDNEGVRIIRDTVKRFEGSEGFKRFMDGVYEAAKNSSAGEGGSKPICVSSVNDRLFVQVLGDYLSVHVSRMNALKNIKVRVLVKEQDFYTIPEGSYLEYRWSQGQNTGSVPFYVYGDKFAIIMFDENSAQQVAVVSISSELASKAYREQFEVLWQNSKIPERKR